MKRPIFPHILIALGTLFLAFTAYLGVTCRDVSPQLLDPPDAAFTQTQRFMDLLSDGDFASAGQLLYGSPAIENVPQFDNAYTLVVWEAFRTSFAYEFTSDFHAEDTGIFREVSVTMLDIPSILPKIEKCYQELLHQQADNTACNADGSRREEFVLSVLSQAAQQALMEDIPRRQQALTLHLVLRDGNWWIQPTADLIELLAGNLATEG